MRDSLWMVSPRFLTAALPALFCALVSSSSARAVPITAGSSAPLPGTTTAARPELAGTVIEDRIRSFSMTSTSGATIRGTFQDRVVKRSGSGTLDFYFRIKNDAGSTGDIVVVNRQNYGAFGTVDVDFRTDGLGTVGAPVAAHGGGASARIKFDFHNAPIKPGQESRFHFIGVPATSYDESGTAFLQGSTGATVDFKIFSPKKPERGPNDGPGDVTHVRRPNLRVKITGPKSAKPGEDISNLIKVRALNVGTAPAPGTNGTLSPANGFMIDVMLSSDTSVPAGFAVYSPSYSEDVLLLGGRISNTYDLPAGGNNSYSSGATIPANTPPGIYYLAVRIDPGNKVAESNEGDNTFFQRIRIR
jgi:hypothetical protein